MRKTIDVNIPKSSAEKIISNDGREGMPNQAAINAASISSTEPTGFPTATEVKAFPWLKVVESRARGSNGLPPDSDLRLLAELHLKTQRELWPSLASCGVLPEVKDESLTPMIESFKACFFHKQVIPFQDTSSGNHWGTLQYSWIRVLPDPTTQYGYTFDTGAKGVDSAFDPNSILNVTNPADATDRIAQIELVGYKSDDDPDDPGGAIFWIIAAPSLSQDSMLPPHDHRSIAPQYGGFAFAVWHPGTGVPQMPWVL
ncbi:MAG TPA: hypothetical protein VM008_15305 [Phycisphaerae bacterium]|nr:hypothetical protein [Phycisphaerae bacterium]